MNFKKFLLLSGCCLCIFSSNITYQYNQQHALKKPTHTQEDYNNHMNYLQNTTKSLLDEINRIAVLSNIDVSAFVQQTEEITYKVQLLQLMKKHQILINQHQDLKKLENKNFVKKTIANNLNLQVQNERLYSANVALINMLKQEKNKEDKTQDFIERTIVHNIDLMEENENLITENATLTRINKELQKKHYHMHSDNEKNIVTKYKNLSRSL